MNENRSAELMLKNPYPSIIKVDEKRAELMLKKPYPSIKTRAAKKTLSKHNKSGLKARTQNAC